LQETVFTVITYDELADGLENAWLMAGLHEHLVIESIAPETLDRTYRAELFPEHPELITEGAAPPWVEMTFTWNPAHQLFSEGRELPPGPLELAWTYTVDVRSFAERNDAELVRAFHGAVRAALRRVAPEATTPAEYIAIEVRRGYRFSGDRAMQSYVQLIGTNVTDLSDLWTTRDPDVLREALRDELIVVSALLHTLADTFTPGGGSGYRSVDSA
jgi:hypothetical protein